MGRRVAEVIGAVGARYYPYIKPFGDNTLRFVRRSAVWRLRNVRATACCARATPRPRSEMQVPPVMRAA